MHGREGGNRGLELVTREVCKERSTIARGRRGGIDRGHTPHWWERMRGGHVNCAPTPITVEHGGRTE
jgi:hypothetical protein